MNVLQKCCFRSMKENRKRTAVTIMGIVMATALITGVACLAASFRASLVEYEKRQAGDFHYCFEGVPRENLKYFQNNRNITGLAMAGEVGYAPLPESQNPDKPYLYIRALDEEGAGKLSLKLVAGRMPENATELVIGRHIRSNGLADYDIGDVLTLDIGQRISEGYQLDQGNAYSYDEEHFEAYDTKTYTVVGIIERPNYGIEERMAPGYSAFTCLETPEEAQIFDVYVSYTDWALRHADKVNAALLGVSGSVWANQRLIQWLLFSFSERSLDILYSMAAIAVTIIIVTSVFCIRNSFQISLMEKMKLYGRLACVGASSRQQRRIVYYEAAFLGLAGIPLGIICGILASVILVQAVGGMVESAVDLPLVFGISIPALLAAVLLSAVTIFLSAAGSARRAAKVSPISAIRANDMVKIRKRDLGCPRFIDRIFGVGGRVAFRNLKRARVKYRTTVISIVVSVAVFIGMTTFVQLADISSHFYYGNQAYQMKVSVYGDTSYGKAAHIAAMEGVQEADIARRVFVNVSTESVPITKEYKELFGIDDSMVAVVYSVGDAAYGKLCGKAGVAPEEAEDKAIVIAEYKETYEEDNKWHSYTGKIAQFQPGDVIRSAGENGFSLEVIAQTDEKPISMHNVSYNAPVLIVSDAWMDRNMDILCELYPNLDDRLTEVYLKSGDTAQLEENVRRYLELSSYTIDNYEYQYQAERSLYRVIAIFLYGFITVVALIGVTNIFNTVTTNMELRAPEFAMLRSIGMTDREFRRMLWLEGLFYGGKALLIGLPLGLLVSLLFHKALGTGIIVRFPVPFAGMAISVAAVFALLFGIMRYSIGRLDRRSLVEIIQNENI